MTIEQKPELNRFVDSSIPVTWAMRWRAFKLALPVWIFACVCMMEVEILVNSGVGQLTWESGLVMAAGSVFMFAFFWGIIEAQLWFYGRSKRTMTIQDKRILMNSTKPLSFRWQYIARFQFEPIPENPPLTKLSVFVHHFRRIVRQFALVIENPAQVPEIIRQLESKRQATSADFKIVVLPKPAPTRADATPSVSAMSLTMAGSYLLLHGLPLLGIALTPRPHIPDNNPAFRPGLATVMGQFLADHFSSVEKLRHFYLVVGIALTAAGLALIFWRMRLDGRKPNA
jgi:hypothetical protein